MSCTVRETVLPRAGDIRVNGVAIPRAAIARESQYHASKSPAEALRAAAQALVVRELLLQEARRMKIAAEPAIDADGRRETLEEALIRALFEREVSTPEPDNESCRRYYDNNRSRFRSPDIYEAAHILFAADRRDGEAYSRARREAEQVIAILRVRPEQFTELARAQSDCSSAAQGGNLGQITSGQTTPEFELALMGLAPGQMTLEPVTTRYGLHVIRLDRKHEGQELPFDLVACRIAEYLHEAVRRRAGAQYIAQLAASAQIEGISLQTTDALRVN